jgi:Calcineurin-like phosphoesterase
VSVKKRVHWSDIFRETCMTDRFIRSLFPLVSTFLFLVAFGDAQIAVRDPAALGFRQRPETRQFPIGRDQLKPSRTISSDTTGAGLLIDLGDTTLYGRVYSGQADFDESQTDFPETRYRFGADIVKGRGSIPLRAYFDQRSRSNANGWVDRGVVGYRLELTRTKNAKPVQLGIFDSRVHFKKHGKKFVPMVTILEPPMVGLICSDHPDWMVINFSTDRPATGKIQVEGGRVYGKEEKSETFEIRLDGLKPSSSYRYRALAIEGPDTAVTPWLHFHTAPFKGDETVVFAYAGDGRAAAGGGEYEYVGVNRAVGSRIAEQVFRKGASFLLFGGDMFSGYINSVDEYEMEWMAFRESYGPLFRSIPLYGAVGNHEALFNAYNDSTSRGYFVLDKWPYDTQSAEAILAQSLINPNNGPKAQPGFPPYDETAFTFQFGVVKVLVINNDYWNTSYNRITQFGGSPEGYVFPEQVEWVRSEVRRADEDPTVRYIIILCHEPFFPGGGHVGDAMWTNGNNNTRAYGMVDGSLKPLGPGLIEVRNQLWEIFAQSPKVAAVLGSDEHNYQRSLITRETPVGIPAKDDKNGNGILDDGLFSPNPAFKNPVWFLISGGAGAPYYTKEPAPWSGSSKFFTPQANYIIFRAGESRIGIEVYSQTGQLLDSVDDLMQVKRAK